MGIFDIFKKNNNMINSDGLNEIYFNEGKSSQVKERFNLKNEIKDGLYEAFNKNGICTDKINFKDGKNHGLEQKSNDEGIVILECNWSNGLKQGITKIFDDDGNLLRELTFTANIPICIKEYYNNGDIKIEYDVPSNKYLFYRKNKKLLLEAYLKFTRLKILQKTEQASNKNSNIKSKSKIAFHSLPDEKQIPFYSNELFALFKKAGYSDAKLEPFGEWSYYDKNKNIKFLLDFSLLEKYGYESNVVLKKDKQSGKKEIMSIEGFEYKWFLFNDFKHGSYTDINKKASNFRFKNINHEPSLNEDFFKLNVLQFPNSNMEKFIQNADLYLDNKGDRLQTQYAFYTYNCLNKCLVEFIALSGLNYKLTDEKIENNEVLFKQYESKDYFLVYEKVENTYFQKVQNFNRNALIDLSFDFVLWIIPKKNLKKIEEKTNQYNSESHSLDKALDVLQISFQLQAEIADLNLEIDRVIKENKLDNYENLIKRKIKLTLQLEKIYKENPKIRPKT
tara:strand:+ start:2614 stop:4131 length:1518 start_codon:yes stop_codon:yes gene_type:complete